MDDNIIDCIILRISTTAVKPFADGDVKNNLLQGILNGSQISLCVEGDNIGVQCSLQ